MEAKHRALVLSGGYSFGAYQVGVMLALASGRCAHLGGEPFDAGIFTGTSIGSVNAALLLSSRETGFASAARHLQRLYLEELASGPGTCGNGLLRLRANPQVLFGESCTRDGVANPFTQLARDAASLASTAISRGAAFLTSSEEFEQRLVQAVDLTALVSAERFDQFIERNVDPARIRASGKALQVLATNWRTGALRVFQPEDLSDSVMRKALIASAAVPGLVPPVNVDGELYADGGVVMNTGLRPAIRAGASELHIVYMDNVSGAKIPARPVSTADTIFRTLTINLASMLNRDIEIATRINSGLREARALRFEGADSISTERIDSFQSAAVLAFNRESRYRELEIHRYRASADLAGVASWLSFDRAHLANLMESGFRDTVSHDCGASGCDKAAAARSAAS